MIDTMIVLALSCWILYKIYKKKEIKLLYVLIFLLLFQLSKWPLYIPTLMSFSFISLAAGGILFYEYYWKRKDKMAISFSILFIAFSIVFFTQAEKIEETKLHNAITKVIEIAKK